MTWAVTKAFERGYSDEKGFHLRIHFCPSCGVGSLMRHDRRLTPEGKPISGKEYWCLICGFSFNVKRSIEWIIATRLFAEHRKMRVGKFEENLMSPEVLHKWKQQYEKPSSETVWPSHGGFSIADKLRGALEQ